MQPWVWAIIIAAFLIIEFSTFQLVSIWFAIGSLCGLILSFIPGVNIYVEVFVSILASLILMIFTRRIIVRWLKTKKINTNTDALIGKQALLISKITSLESGKVKINGVVWNVTSNQEIQEGEIVRILNINGNRLDVEPINNQVN